MNLRSTAWLFALMLSMLWLFGLMLAFKKNPLDKSYVVPTLQAARDYDITSVTVQRKPKDKEAQEFQFTQDNDVWRLKDAAANQAVKVEGFRINDIVNQIKNARKDEEADVTNDLARFGLDHPQTTITIHGRAKSKPPEVKDEDKEDKKDEKKAPAPTKEKDWKFFMGGESADKKYVYANSSDEPTRVFAVTKSSIDALFFADANHLRSKRLFEFNDATARTIDIKQGAAELELKKGDDNVWRFVKPSLGFADFEGPPPPKDLSPIAKAPEGGIKGLISAILNIRIDSDADFVAPGKDNLSKYQLEDGKEAIRIQVGTADGKKDSSKETVLVGSQERGYYYARLANDEGVFKLPEKLLTPVLKALKNPGELRSLDVGQFDPKAVDAVTLRYGKDEKTKLWHPDGKPWQLEIAGDKQKKANEAATTKLLETLLGKRQIQEFRDADGGDAKKLDVELGLNSPSLVIAVYVGGLEKKDDAKKDEKKDKKDDKEKKEPKQDDGFALKKDAKAALTLRFGKATKETVAVERVTADGLVSRFTVPRAMLDVAAPPEGPLAFLDPALPPFDSADIVKLELQRGTKKVDLEKGTGNQAHRWVVKEGQDKADQNLADIDKTEKLFRALGAMQAKKWIKRLDPKDNLDDYGFKALTLTSTVQVKKQRITPAGAASTFGMLTGPIEARLLAAAGAFAANLQGDKGETITIQFGQETADKDKDVYVKHSGSDLLFVVPGDLVKSLRELDLRDKTALLVTQHVLGVGLVGAVAGQPLDALAALAPVNTGAVLDLDPAKVKEIRLALRNSFELRELTFQRKDKSWIDTSGLKDFQVDTDKVEQFAKDISRLRADRFVSLAGGPKADHKLGVKDYLAKIDLIGDDGKTTTITIGAALDRRGHFAHASNWPDAVFLIPDARLEPLTRGIGSFAKERVAGRE